jgi:hypothetical protein
MVPDGQRDGRSATPQRISQEQTNDQHLNIPLIHHNSSKPPKQQAPKPHLGKLRLCGGQVTTFPNLPETLSPFSTNLISFPPTFSPQPSSPTLPKRMCDTWLRIPVKGHQTESGVLRISATTEARAL